MADQHFFKTGETAKLCGVTLRTVLNWIQKGLLKAHQLPGSRGDNRIGAKDLLAFMQSYNIPIPDELSAMVSPEDVHILIVDDDPAMANAIGRVLRAEGRKLHFAKNGFEAGRLFEKLKPQLMTLDLQMPGVNGLDLLAQLQDRSHTRILVISATGQEALQRALSLSADDVLPKPFDNIELEKKVLHLLNKH